ncbi:MAG TPA: HD domain-containing phosphohydrolase [Feifaniaceae bacterium]|nr:HD domain-containing phosphohydrolase [Feifaniaceae bacterium]
MKKAAVCALLFIGLLLPFAVPAKAYSSADFTDMMQTHPAVMLLVDPYTGEIRYANAAAATYYGYSAERLAQMSFSEISASPSDTNTAFGNRGGAAQFTHRLKDGSLRSVEITAGIVTVDGRLMNLLIVQDITEKIRLLENERKEGRLSVIIGSLVALTLFALLLGIGFNRKRLKRLAASLETSNALMRSFYDADESGLYLKDENLRYVFVNKAGESMHGVLEKDTVGKDDYAIFDREFAEERRSADRYVLEHNTPTLEEFTHNGRAFKIKKFPVTLEDGKCGVGSYARDITDEIKYARRQAFALKRSEIAFEMMNHNFESMEEQLGLVLLQMQLLTQSRFGCICLYDEKKRELTLFTFMDLNKPEAGAPDLLRNARMEEAGFWSKAVAQRKPVVVNHIAGGERRFFRLGPEKEEALREQVELTNYMAFPVLMDGGIAACVGLFNRDGGYDMEDAAELSLLMDGVWNSMKRRQALSTLHFERNKYLQTLISIGDGVMVVNARGMVEMLNGVAEKLTGWSAGEAAGRHYKEVFALSHEQHGFTIKDPIEDALLTNEVQELGNHAMLTSRCGDSYYLEDSAAPIRDEQGNTMGVVLVFRDVTDKKEQRKKIEFLSFHDSLTGLYNRRYFEEEMQRVDASGVLPVSIILGDVNSLKLTNDIFGHAFGDMLLERVSEVLRGVFGPQGVIARWGGDEFVILMPGATAAQAEEAIASVTEAFGKEQVRAIRGSISMGYATKAEAEEPLGRVLAAAEENMYSAKSLNRDDVRSRAIDAITASLYESSSREREHAERVSELSVRLGRALGLSEVKLKKLKEVARLHDIGKIVLEPNILNKNHLLTLEEWNEVKRHPIIGYRILNSFDDTVDLAESVLAHHEQWDGAGYPKGLKGEEIPLLARIVAVVESYERMTHDSDNTKARTKEDALRELRENAGGQFDPMLAELFARMLEEGA